jgi:hypothetical protein
MFVICGGFVLDLILLVLFKGTVFVVVLSWI